METAKSADGTVIAYDRRRAGSPRWSAAGRRADAVKFWLTSSPV